MNRDDERRLAMPDEHQALRGFLEAMESMLKLAPKAGEGLIERAGSVVLATGMLMAQRQRALEAMAETGHPSLVRFAEGMRDIAQQVSGYRGAFEACASVNLPWRLAKQGFHFTVVDACGEPVPGIIGCEVSDQERAAFLGFIVNSVNARMQAVRPEPALA